MKPKIGITMDRQPRSNRSPREPVYTLPGGYSEAIEGAGGLPVALPVMDDPRSIRETAGMLDGLLVTGGAFDIPPELYGASRKRGLGALKVERTRFELAMLESMLAANRPVLGVCGGEQLLAVALGGTLIQDIPRERPEAKKHEQKAPKTRATHAIEIVPKSLLARAMGVTASRVNTTHHQAVNEPGPRLRIVALAPDGIVEGIESLEHRWTVGVQWHPEILSAPEHARLFKAFVRAARR